MKTILLGIFAGFTAMALALGQEDASPGVVRITVEPATVVSEIANDFIGFGYETSAVAREGYFSAKNSRMVALYRSLTTSGLVRIGGIIGDHTRYEPEGTPVAHAMQGITVINRAVLEELGGFLRATGWKAMWTLNLGTGSKEEAAEEALAVQAALGDRLHSLEIGNEVDLLRRFDGFPSYHKAYVEYKAAVRAVLPSAQFSGPDSANNVDWAAAFAQAEARDMKLLIHHYYRGGAKSGEATIETLLGRHAEWETKLARLQDICAANAIAFRINEVNSFFGGGKADVSDTFASALWCLDYMFRLATYGGVGVNMETDVNQLGFISHYSPIYREENGELTARPEYYGMLAFAMAGNGKLVKTTVSPTTINLTAYATQTVSESVWVVVINKDLTRQADLELSMGNSLTTAQAIRLSAASLRSKAEVTLGGAQITAEGTWSGGVTEAVAIRAGRATLAVPAGSAVLVQVK